jgi:hypothetical protein
LRVNVIIHNLIKTASQNAFKAIMTIQGKCHNWQGKRHNWQGKCHNWQGKCHNWQGKRHSITR